MAVVRWRFTDPETDEVWTVPINPREMSSPHPVRNRQTLPAGPAASNQALSIRTLQEPLVPFEWTFGGVIRTQAHHDDLLAWSRKPNPILIRDHFLRTWRVIPTVFDATDRRPTARVPWRMTYTMHTQMLGRIS